MHKLDTLIEDINSLNEDFFLKQEGNETQATFDERPYPLNINKKLVRFSVTQNTYLLIISNAIVPIGDEKALEQAKDKFYREFLKTIVFFRLPIIDEAQFRYSKDRKQP